LEEISDKDSNVYRGLNAHGSEKPSLVNSYYSAIPFGREKFDEASKAVTDGTLPPSKQIR
jgi:hypothetical protein